MLSLRVTRCTAAALLCALLSAALLVAAPLRASAVGPGPSYGASKSGTVDASDWPDSGSCNLVTFYENSTGFLGIHVRAKCSVSWTSKVGEIFSNPFSGISWNVTLTFKGSGPNGPYDSQYTQAGLTGEGVSIGTNDLAWTASEVCLDIRGVQGGGFDQHLSGCQPWNMGAAPATAPSSGACPTATDIGHVVGTAYHSGIYGDGWNYNGSVTGITAGTWFIYLIFDNTKPLPTKPPTYGVGDTAARFRTAWAGGYATSPGVTTNVGGVTYYPKTVDPVGVGLVDVTRIPDNHSAAGSPMWKVPQADPAGVMGRTDPSICSFYWGKKIADTGSATDTPLGAMPLPTDPPPAPEPTDQPGDVADGGSCDFSISDPGTWLSGGMCSLVGLMARAVSILGKLPGLLGSIVSAVGAIPAAILNGLGNALSALFIPDAGVMGNALNEISSGVTGGGAGWWNAVSGVVGGPQWQGGGSGGTQSLMSAPDGVSMRAMAEASSTIDYCNNPTLDAWCGPTYGPFTPDQSLRAPASDGGSGGGLSMPHVYPAFLSCSGPGVEMPEFMTDAGMPYIWRPINACEGEMQVAAVWFKRIASVTLSMLALFKCIEIIGSGMGWHKEQPAINSAGKGR